MRQLTSIDAQFLAMETATTFGHVSGLCILDPTTTPGGTLTIDDIRTVVGERLHLLPPFRWRLASVPLSLDHPYWIEDPDFDLDFHIRESAIPPPGGPHQLARTIERIVARKLDRAHPLWELYLIHGLADGKVGMFTKVHHAAVDGVSGAEILSILLDQSPEGRQLDLGEVPRRVPAPTQFEMLVRGLVGVPRQPWRALQALPTTLVHAEALPGVNLIPGLARLAWLSTRLLALLPGTPDGGVLKTEAVRAPETRFNATISPHRRFAFASISLDQVREIKHAVGVTVNDVVIAICAAGLRSWLIDHDELPDDPLVAMVPLSVRTAEQRGTFGNRVSMMFVPIPTDTDDPQQALLRAHQTMSGAKERFHAMPADILQDLTQFLPPAVLARASRVSAQLGGIQRLRPLNVVISNVPGPRSSLFMAGALLEAQFPVSVITDGAGLNITCLSYRDHIDFGIVADREQMDDAWPLMAAIEQAAAEFHAAVVPAAPAPVEGSNSASRERERTLK
jgi:diacylglycerol O-acyltransferase / wax synthase